MSEVFTPANPSTKGADLVRRLLWKKLRCTLSDGRVVVGEFQCLDQHRNFILVGVDESQIIKDASGADCLVKRRLNQVMVPGKHLARVEVEQSVYEAAQAEVAMASPVAVLTPTLGS